MKKRELLAAGCLAPDTVAEAAGLYEEEDIQGTKEEITLLLRALVERNGEENTYFDFYYGSLSEEEKQRIDTSLSEEEAEFLRSLSLPEDRTEVYFPYEETLFDIALKLSLNSSLFSTFYFAATKETVWSNYDCRFLRFTEKTKGRRIPDNHEMCLKYYELVLERQNIHPGDIAEHPLPGNYRFVYYRPGDEAAWIQIEVSARELMDEQEGREIWEQYYGEKEDELSRRMLFIEDADGRKVATATAFYEPRDTSGAGWLHWVAVSREEQGKGLAKPLIARALHQLTALGYTAVKIPTQTTSWVAARIYMDFGFRAVPENAARSLYGYRILKTLTNHPSLEALKPLAYEEIWDEDMLTLEEKLKERYPQMTHFCMREKDGRKKVLLRCGCEVMRLDYAALKEEHL